ncbi:MAG: hypothetical protein IIX01_00045, partial [Clostridia bacterium]|nr:hypothetical protein [Clostridia bacterium]
QEKMRRMVTALVVAATTLLVSLLAVIVYQAIALTVNKNRIEKLEKDIQYYEQVISEGKLDLEYYESLEGLENAARRDGWTKIQKD